jgi:NAD(P)-dependent dehydrogenase (short-subunit alcohol dehydrogenase family)
MDLGIRGRTAIICASSQGLARGCAQALAAAGVSVVINGRNQSLLAACPAPDISINNNGGRPFATFVNWIARRSRSN